MLSQSGCIDELVALFKEQLAAHGYRSKERLSGLRKKGFKLRITYKARRGQPLRSRQIALNHSYSKLRCRVEHVFGAMKNNRKARSMTCLGLNRSRVGIGLGHLCYNIKRLSYLERDAVALQGALCHECPNEGGGVCPGVIKG